MDRKIPLVSYTLAALSGICFIGGLAILSREGRNDTWTDLRDSYPCSTTRWTHDESDISQEVFL